MYVVKNRTKFIVRNKTLSLCFWFFFFCYCQTRNKSSRKVFQGSLAIFSYRIAKHHETHNIGSGGRTQNDFHEQILPTAENFQAVSRYPFTNRLRWQSHFFFFSLLLLRIYMYIHFFFPFQLLCSNTRHENRGWSR